MGDRKFVNLAAPGRGEPHQHFAAVVLAGDALDGAGGFETVHKLDGAVMLEEHPQSQFADSGFGAFRQALEREQKLMLLGLNAALFSRGFAEMQELTDLAAEFSQIPVMLEG